MCVTKINNSIYSKGEETIPFQRGKTYLDKKHPFKPPDLPNVSPSYSAEGVCKI